jgi:O-antigen ligase
LEQGSFVLVSRLFVETKTAILKTIGGNNQTDFLETAWISKGLPLLLGCGLGVCLAWLIVSGNWPVVFGLLLVVPSLILLNTYPFAALIIWALVSPFLQTTPNAEMRMVYWMIHRALPPLALGLVVFANLLKVTEKRRHVKLGRAEWAVVFYIGLGLVNIFWFQSSPLSYLYLYYDRVLVPICLYWLIRLVAPSERDIRRLMPVAFILVLVESVAGVLSWFAPQVLPPDWLTLQGARTTGSMVYPHAYTTTLIFFIFLLFQDAMNRRRGVIRSTFLLTFGFGAICVFLSFSRGSWLGGIAAVAGLLLMYPKTMVRMTVILLISMSLLGSGVLSEQMAFARERMNSEDTAMDRWVIWDAGLQMIEAKPFFGWGYGNYESYAGQFQRRVYNYVAARAHASHNSYIAIPAELGLPAFFLFAFPVLWWLMLSLKIWPRMPTEGFWSRSLLLVFWMVILDHIVVNSFSDMTRSTYGMGMWWITLGLIANMVDTYLQPEDLKLPVWVQRAGQTTASGR